MESAYGIGVRNRYALFLDEDDDSPGLDPYALLTNAAPDGELAAKSKLLAAGVPTLAGKQQPGSGPKQQQQQQSSPLNPAAKTNLKPTGTLSESKANVVANQKDFSGRRDTRDNRSGSRSGNQTQRPTFNRGDQENRTQRSPRQNNAFDQQRSPRPFGESKGEEGGELKEGNGRDFRDGKNERRNGFGQRGGGGRGGRGGFVAGGGQGGQRFDRKRDFNRHSGSDKTGVKSTDKRDGAGAHNWGKPGEDFGAPPEDELVNGEQTGAEAPAEGTEGTEGTPSGEEKTGTEEEVPKIDEPIVKTLDEYKREREEKRLHAQFNTRKANEGEDKTKWKKTYVLKKKPIADEEEVEYEEIEVEEDANKRRGRQVLDIEVNFRPSDEGREFVRRGRGGPGGRGRGAGGDRPRGGDNDRRPAGGDREPRAERPAGDRGERGENSGPRTPRGAGPGGPRGGGGGRGGGRGGRFQATPKFDDYNDFPSL